MSAPEGAGHRSALPVATVARTRALLRGLVRPHRGLAWGTGLVLTGRAAAGLAAPAVVGHTVDLVVRGAPAGALTWPLALLAAAVVLEAALALAGGRLVARLAETLLARLREDVVERTLDLPLEKVERAGTGDLLSRVGDDVSVVSEAGRESFPLLITSGLTVLLTLVGLAALDWRLAVAGLLAAPVQVHTLRWYLRRSNPLYVAERARNAERTHQLFDTVDGADTVRAWSLEAAHLAALTDRADATRSVALASARLRLRFFGRLNLAEFTGLTAILVTGFFLVAGLRIGDLTVLSPGTATVGAVTAAGLYFVRLFDPFNTLLFFVDEAQRAGAALARLVGVVDLPRSRPPTPSYDDAGTGDPVDIPSPSPASSTIPDNAAAEVRTVADSAAPGAEVEVCDLSFAYAGGVPVLHDVSLRLPAGATVALVGVSGAGKTTLAGLIAGVRPVTTGRIRLGVPAATPPSAVAGSTAAGERGRPAGGTGNGEANPVGIGSPALDGAARPVRVAMVSQEVHTFVGTLADDLRLARPGAGDAELAAAVDLVGARRWVDGLPDGLQTVVGSGGHRLTATQAQQIALARLALADPALAVLDEASAEAGSAGATVLEAAARRVLAGRTALVVAHRLTQAATADRVVVMAGGRVVEEGTHDDLVAAGGRYAELWAAWSGART